jgi:hypothetical protein
LFKEAVTSQANSNKSLVEMGGARKDLMKGIKSNKEEQEDK